MLSERSGSPPSKSRAALLRMEFTTRNTLPPDAQIVMQLVEGPFRTSSASGASSAIGERGSRVQFRVEFEFKNRLMAVALNAVFESVCSTIVDAFVVRAQQDLREAERKIEPPEAPGMRVEVVYALPQRAIVKTYAWGRRRRSTMRWPSAAADPDFSGIDLDHAPVGIFGRPAGRDQPLNDGDRIEIYRPLAVDPKAARRARAKQRRKPIRSASTPIRGRPDPVECGARANKSGRS